MSLDGDYVEGLNQFFNESTVFSSLDPGLFSLFVSFYEQAQEDTVGECRTRTLKFQIDNQSTIVSYRVRRYLLHSFTDRSIMSIK